MINPITAIQINNNINDWNDNANVTLKRLKKERGRIRVRIEETRLHDADANQTYKTHLENIEQMITSIETAIDTVSKNRSKIVLSAAKI